MSYTDVALRIGRESGWTPGTVQQYLDALAAAGYDEAAAVELVERSTAAELDAVLAKEG